MPQEPAKRTVAIFGPPEHRDQAKQWWGPIWRGRVTRASVFLICLAILLARPSAEEGSLLDLGLETVGWLLWLVGGSVRIWATLYIGGRKGRTVVDEGPYSLCRNPLYVGTLLLAVSAAFFLQSITLAIAILLLMILYARGTVPGEERVLRETFGETYEAYAARVPRYWPRLRGYRASPTVVVTLRQLGREYRRAMLWLWLPWIGELVATLHERGWWPHLFRLP